LLRRSLIEQTAARQLAEADPTDLVRRFHELELSAPASRQSLLRDWVSIVVPPLFSLDHGTAAFTPEDPLDPEQRIFLSTPAVILEAVRSLSNGLIIRSALGDMKREIGQASDSQFSMDRLPLQEAERKVAESLHEPKTIEAFLRDFSSDSLGAAKVVIALLTLGVFAIVEAAAARTEAFDEDQMQKDMQLLATLGSSNPKALEAVAFARQSERMDFYKVLDVPRGALRGQIMARADELRKKFDQSNYPVLIKDYLDIIRRRIDEAAFGLSDPVRRQEYDKLLTAARRDDTVSVQQRLTRRSIAEQNFRKARELSIAGDYWGAIVLLRQAVEYAPDHAEAWYILGTCLEQNPKWRREAVEAFQRALSFDPNMVDALLSLGDLYKGHGMTARAIACYEDALQIDPENAMAKTRLKNVAKK
ncbi:MAG TPA: tetratricopeptide repeat protein, partial [Thermoanaerobaculia bacterium]|nr:tetratricopeptide repeat protein [Thermoanaerobaculia bacterium]